ncbi:MAG: hypothetical protein ACRCXD_03920 [Luteolibacter sp.]
MINFLKISPDTNINRVQGKQEFYESRRSAANRQVTEANKQKQSLPTRLRQAYQEID